MDKTDKHPCSFNKHHNKDMLKLILVFGMYAPPALAQTLSTHLSHFSLCTAPYLPPSHQLYKHVTVNFLSTSQTWSRSSPCDFSKATPTL